jgi:integrase
VADLLAWYRDRSATDRNLTKARKGVIKWAIDKHLIPTLGRFVPANLNRTVLDSAFFWPKQSELENATLRSVWAVLKQAFNQAYALEMIQANMMAGVQYSDFISAKIQPKETEIQTQSVAGIVTSGGTEIQPAYVLVLLMLLHGTRIGETRRLKWVMVDKVAQVLTIPGELTKNQKDHAIPLTPYALQVLDVYRAYQKKQRYQGVWLFPNKTRKHCINADQASKWMRSVSGREWCSHSLRKAARTIWLDIGIDYLIGEMLLNHSLSKLDQAYIHTHAQTQKRQALDTYHAWLDERTGFYLSRFGIETLTRSDAKTMHLNTNEHGGSGHE